MAVHDWIGAMRLICGGARHGGIRHWLDWCNGIGLPERVALAGSGGGRVDIWEPAMGARDTGSRWWDLFMGVCQMTKYYTVAEIKWWYHVSSCLALGWRALKSPTSETPVSEVMWTRSRFNTSGPEPLGTDWGPGCKPGTVGGHSGPASIKQPWDWFP